VRLSRSGSGLKTIILVLAYIHLLPLLEGSDSAKYLYGFEELENNLHPALQRRLLRFLRDFSTQVGCHFFLTTHSPVEIDYFARDEHAQVLHVTHDQMNAR
jgi:putative ATP-dependent endonuclease of OLD family